MIALSKVRFGQTNDDVRAVQRALIARGRKIPDGPTGFFGEQTKAAYQAEQRAQGFKGADADGIPGCKSLTELGRHGGFAVDCRGPQPQHSTGTPADSLSARSRTRTRTTSPDWPRCAATPQRPAN